MSGHDLQPPPTESRSDYGLGAMSRLRCFHPKQMNINRRPNKHTLLHRIGNLSVFYKLLIWFLVSILPLSILFLVINSRSRENVRSHYERSLEARTRHYIDLLEQEVASILLLQREYVNEPDIQMLAGRVSIMSPYYVFQAVRNIETRLAYLVNYSRYIDEVSVYLPLYGRVLSGNAPIQYATQEWLDFILTANSNASGPLFLYKGGLYLNLPYPIANPYLPKRDPNLVITIRLSADEFRAQLAQFVEYESGAAALYCTGTGWTAVNSPDWIDAGEIAAMAAERVEHEPEGGTAEWRYGKNRYMVIHRYSRVLDLGLVVFFPVESALSELKRYRFYLFLISGLTASFLVFYAWIMFRTINIPLSRIVHGFKLVEDGNLDIDMPITRNDEFGYVMKRFGIMVGKLKETIQLEYESRIHANQAELKQLQYQINPHFLYNSLYMIHRMATLNDVDNISRLSRHLSRYYMYLNRGESLLVTLKEEISHAQDYLAIQAMRFPDRIRTDVEEPEDVWTGCRVPRLIIQPVLENAFRHGLEASEDGGHVKLFYRSGGRTLDIIIENSGRIDAGILERLNRRLDSPYDRHESVSGLVNVHRRLRIAFGDRCGVRLANTSSGFRVTLRVTDKTEFA